MALTHMLNLILSQEIPAAMEALGDYKDAIFWGITRLALVWKCHLMIYQIPLCWYDDLK